MITIPEAVKELISQSPFLEEGLSQNLINLSALARKIKPELEEKLYKKVQTGAIIMALKRFSGEAQGKNKPLRNILTRITDITVRSNIVEFTYSKSPTLPKNVAMISEHILTVPNSFLTVTNGIFESSIFASTNLQNKIEEVFKQERIKIKHENLSSITIMLPEEAPHISGVYYAILKKLAWEGISIIEVASSYTELTIFLDKKDIDRAFSALKEIS